jgi:hypothetical protein
VTAESGDVTIEPFGHRQRVRLRRRAATAAAAAALAGAVLGGGFTPVALGGQAVAGAQPQPRQLTIPYLANDSKPQDLDFAAAKCDVAQDGQRMECRFRQVFVTTASHDATVCVITSNGYTLPFDKVSATRWVSVGAPDGVCGVVETTTLDDGGGTRWTMTVRRAATGDIDRDECRARPVESEVYSWRNVRRPLPCRTIQPGAIER